MMNSPSSTPNLVKQIINDLFRTSRWTVILFVLIGVSAMSVVFVTHHTRYAIMQKEQALLERERLDTEWRNLILEETSLSEHTRVQALAIKELNMTRPDAKNEVVVTLP